MVRSLEWLRGLLRHDLVDDLRLAEVFVMVYSVSIYDAISITPQSRVKSLVAAIPRCELLQLQLRCHPKSPLTTVVEDDQRAQQ